MISLNFRLSETINFESIVRSYCDSQFNNTTYGEIEESIQLLSRNRIEIINAHKVKSNPTQIETLIKKTIQYLGILNVLAQTFVIGKGKNQLDISFIWYDSITNEKKISSIFLLERLSMLYNLGVMYGVLGLHKCSSSNPNWKDAKKIFEKASWVFLEIKSEITNISATQITTDLFDFNITLLHFLMLAQAQICGYEIARIGKASNYALSIVTNQVSAFYGKCLGCLSNTQLPKDKLFKPLIASLFYGEHLYDAFSYFYAAESINEDKNKAVNQFGFCVLYGRKLLESLMQIQNTYAKDLPPEIKKELDSQIETFTKIKNKYEEENNKIYFC